MGYQLWTSPVTGYRRRGTRLADFHLSLGAKITGNELFEPLRCCPSEASASEMRDTLAKLDFDVAGVKDGCDLPVIGFVRRVSLKSGLVRGHLETIPPEMVVPASINIEALLDRFSDRPLFFVAVDGVLNGILTLADLNKPIVRVYIFGLLSLLEIHMSFWVANEYDGESWKAVLTPGRIEQAAKVRSDRNRRGQSLNLEDCLQFADKRELIVARDRLRRRFGLESKTKAAKRLGDAETLRNTLAHSQYDLVQGGTWPDLIDLVRWVRAVIARSDEFVEAHAAEMAQRYIGALW